MPVSDEQLQELRQRPQLDIEIGPDTRRTNVMVNGKFLPVTGLTVDLEAGDTHPYIELRTLPMGGPSESPVKISGIFVENGERIEQLETAAQWARVVRNNAQRQGVSEIDWSVLGLDLLDKALVELDS